MSLSRFTQEKGPVLCAMFAASVLSASFPGKTHVIHNSVGGSTAFGAKRRVFEPREETTGWGVGGNWKTSQRFKDVECQEQFEIFEIKKVRIAHSELISGC